MCARLGADWHLGQLAIHPHHAALAALDAFQHGHGRAARHAAHGQNAEHQARGRRQAPVEVRGQAVRRHDVKPGAGQQHDAGPLGFVIAGGQRLEDRNLAGDVEIVDAAAQAAIGHRLRRTAERPGAVQHDLRPAGGSRRGQELVHRRGVVQPRHAVLQAKFLCQRRHRGGVAPGQDRPHPRLPRPYGRSVHPYSRLPRRGSTLPARRSHAARCVLLQHGGCLLLGHADQRRAHVAPAARRLCARPGSP